MKKIKETFLFKPDILSLVLILLGTLLNIIGDEVADLAALPIWLDNVGTMTVAIVLGPIAGSISGILSGIGATLIFSTPLPYALVGLSVGMTTGLFFPRNNRDDTLRIVSVAILAALISTAMCVPLNVRYYGGYTGNIWSNALYDMLSHTINSTRFNTFTAEIFVDGPDMVASIFLAMFLSSFVSSIENKLAKKKKHRNPGGTSGAALVLALAASVCLTGVLSEDVSAKAYIADYEEVTFGSEDGIITAEVNAVAQTDDGYLWVGTYSGLYIYDGVRFEPIEIHPDIANVMCFFVDSSGRLWIGTNDSGAFRYDPRTGETVRYSIEEGIAADSIRCICEDTNGNIYIGTVLDISRIAPDGTVKTYSELTDIYYIQDMTALGDGSVAGVTNNGILFIIKDNMLVSVAKCNRGDGVNYRSIAASKNKVLVGTSSDIVEIFGLSGNEMHYRDYIKIKESSYFNNMIYSPEHQGFFYCCENGMGFINEISLNDVALRHNGLIGAVNGVCIDDQSNVWFTSSKQGLIKFSQTPFQNIFKRTNIQASVVNAVLINDNKLYIGTDTGIKAIELGSLREVSPKCKRELAGVRIRNFFKDSKGRIWISTFGKNGLVYIDEDGELQTVVDPENLTEGVRFRFVMELNDGRLLASGSSGLFFIEDNKITKALSEADGLNNQFILSAVQREDGAILAGSDGDGIYIIKNDMVAGHIGKNEGLTSAVVLRIVRCTGGYIYVTSNCLYYDNGTEVRRLENFPYSNNYDIQMTGDGRCFITSSAGLYIANEADIIEDGDYGCTLLNKSWGLNTTFTANSWNIQHDGFLYLCCTDGVRRLSPDSYRMITGDYRLQLKSIVTGDSVIQKNGEIWKVPPTASRIQFNIAVNNYSLSNPLIHYYLEGTEDEGITCLQNDIVPLSFTNLPYGKYRLHICVIDNSGQILKDEITDIEKDAMMYERLWFKAYLMFVCVMFVMYVVWLFYTINKRAMRIRGLQKEMSTDPMTGILNKAGATAALEKACKTDMGTLLMIDLDSFKLINDIYGHDMGDKILIRFAELLRESSHENDIVGRMGGDEFVGFIRNTHADEDIDNMTKFLNREITRSAKDYMGENMNIPIGTSIGAVRVPTEGRDFHELFKLADKALYMVKQNGKHGCSFYQGKSSVTDGNTEKQNNGDLDHIMQIIGERNEGKGAYLVNFDKLQIIYKFLTRNARVTGIRNGFIRLYFDEEHCGAVSDELRDLFEEHLVVGMRRNDVISRYSGSFFILCTGAADYEELVSRLTSEWKKTAGCEDHIILSEIRVIGG